MKSFFSKIDNSLLEKFPLIWNTRVHWVALLSIGIHLVFYIWGYSIFRNPTLLQQHYVEQIYIYNGVLLFSVVCSILIIIVWLFFLLRNNGFKNFYPTNRWQLFASFLIYFLVFLLSTTFFSSYATGFKHYINKEFPDSRMEHYSETSNVAAAFLSQRQDDYTIDQRKYPAPFDTLYCEVTEDFIDFSSPYLQRFNNEYQFYTVAQKMVSVNANNINWEYDNSISTINISDSVILFAHRGDIVDVSGIVDSRLSYRNYSASLVGKVHSSGDLSSPSYFQLPKVQNAIAMNKKVVEVIERNSTEELKELFSSFLAIAHEFQIETNLSPEVWLSLIDRDSFYVQKFIRLGKLDLQLEYELTEDITAANSIRDTPENRNQKQQFFRERRTDYYFESAQLESAFVGIESIKTYNYWQNLFQFQVWVAFSLAIVLFAFRVTGLVSVFFAAITATVISILTALFAMGINNEKELLVSYLLLVIGTIIIVLPILFHSKVRKNIQAVCINLSLVGFVPYIFLVLLIITLHQEDYFKQLMGDNYYNERPILLLDYLEEQITPILLLAGMIILSFYTFIIRRWKALPEE